MALVRIPLIISLDNSFSERANFIAQKFGSGGVTDRATRGINPIALDLQISGNVLNKTALETFLKAQGLKPFRYDYDGQPHPSEPFICVDYGFEHIYSTVHNFTATFQRTFRFGI